MPPTQRDPAGQGEQKDAFPGEKEPFTQGNGCDAPHPQKNPAGQLVQDVESLLCEKPVSQTRLTALNTTQEGTAEVVAR
jgi:hypothetical protein